MGGQRHAGLCTMYAISVGCNTVARAVSNHSKELRVTVAVQRLFRKWSEWNKTHKIMMAQQARLGKGCVLMQALFRGFRVR
jgi:hypothetical protein